MVANHVFIPSRGRWHGAHKLVNFWRKQGFTVHFVVEPSEAPQYREALRAATREQSDLFAHQLPTPNQGIAASRRHCVDIAASYGLASIILADDDIKPAKDGNMEGLIKVANNPKVLGVTAKYSYHDLCLGDGIRGRSDIILLPTGTFRLVGLNIKNVLAIGNYDRNLEYAEDCDLFLRGLKAGFPWMVHLGTWSNSMGNRYEPGGMLDYAGGDEVSLKLKKRDWHEDLYDKYPEVVNDPARVKNWDKQNTIIVQWQRAYDKWLPDWRKWSALHGGSLAYYLNGDADA